MKVEIKGPDTDLTIPVPSALVMNRVAMGAVVRNLNRKHGFSLDPALAGKLLKAAKAYRRDHPEWVLVEVLSANGETVRITL